MIRKIATYILLRLLGLSRNTLEHIEALLAKRDLAEEEYRRACQGYEEDPWRLTAEEISKGDRRRVEREQRLQSN